MSDRLRAALAEVSGAAASFLEATQDYDQLLPAIARAGAKALRATCSLALFDEGGQTMTPVATHDDDPEVAAVWTPFLGKPRPVNAPLSQEMARSGGLFIPNLDVDAMSAQIPTDSIDGMRKLRVRGLIGVTMRVRGAALGWLTAMRHSVPEFDELDREIAISLASLAGLAIENARLFRVAREAEATLFLNAIIENIPDMVFVKEADQLSFVRFNRAGEQLLGFPRAALLGKNDFDFFPRDEAEFFVAKDRETLRSKALVDIPEEKINTANGERWLHTKKVPIVDAAGVPRYLLGISEDITDRKSEAAALRVAKETAEAANKELEAFSYSVAHDLRAPLRAIDGFSQALVEDYAAVLGDLGRNYCGRIRESAQRMAVLIDDLLKLSRVTRAEMRRTPVDLGTLFRASLETLQQLEPDRRVEISVADLTVDADPRLLSIVLDNLCSNAWKFTSKKQTARIELGTTIVDGERAFFVRDDGIGFDMSYASKLFGVFQRLHAESEFPGTGIGLATVQRIIARHGGRTWAEGTVGAGATFYFTLQPKATP